jgi:3-isopropylmalate/(R)-2-methylmalate dehydratase large subunit
MTMAEKVLARKAGQAAVSPGEYVWAEVDGTALIGVFSVGVLDKLARLGVDRVWDPSRVYAVEDHMGPANTTGVANTMVELRRAVKTWGIENYFELGRHGIMHELFPQHGYCSPGDLIASVDSHSTSYGCFNVASCGMNEDLFYVLATGTIWLRVPPSIRFELGGTIAGADGFVVGKDVALRIGAEYGTDVGLYKSLEFAGDGVHAMTMASRFSIANMGAELGAKFAMFPCDDKTLEALDGKMKRPPDPVEPDPDAEYEAVHVVDVGGLGPWVARPHDPGNGAPVEEVASERVLIHQAFLGSCTNARMEDYRMAARILQGRRLHPDVRLIATPASMDIWRQCGQEGIWDIFAEAGALVTSPGCGACPGTGMGVLGDDEVCISSSNRNFQGRMGSPSARVYLANPATVAASAVRGIICDPREFL